jgi:hypothetical protein
VLLVRRAVRALEGEESRQERGGSWFFAGDVCLSSFHGNHLIRDGPLLTALFRCCRNVQSREIMPPHPRDFSWARGVPVSLSPRAT